MQLLLLLASCLACVAAKPLLFLTYAGSNGGPRASFLNCAFPVPVYDEANNRITYRCPSRAPIASPQVSLLEVDELTDEDGNVEMIEVIEEVEEQPGLHVGHSSSGGDVVVVPLDSTKPQDQRTGSYQDSGKCPPGQFWIAELDICVDWDPSGTPTTPRPVADAPTTKKPKRPKPGKPNRPKGPKDKVIGPAESLVKDDESIGITIGEEPRPRCSMGQVYVSELDICVPYNNCWPHSDECDDD